MNKKCKKDLRMFAISLIVAKRMSGIVRRRMGEHEYWRGCVALIQGFLPMLSLKTGGKM